MKNIDSIDGKQHYVSQFLLRNFSSRHNHKKNLYHIWVYNRKTNSYFEPNISRILCETDFYNIPYPDLTNIFSENVLNELNKFIDENLLGKHETKLTYDKIYSNLEIRASLIITAIIKDESLVSLTSSEMEILAMFLAFQMIRIPRIRELVTNITDSPSKNPEQHHRTAKIQHLEWVAESQRYHKIFLKKRWILLKAPQDINFILSDNPVNGINISIRKTLLPPGLLHPDRLLYLPISPHLCLVLFHDELIKEAPSNPGQSYQIDERILALVKGETIEKRRSQLLSHLNSRDALPARREAVNYFNMYQFLTGEYILASDKKYLKYTHDQIIANTASD